MRPIHRVPLRHFSTAPEKSMFKTVLIVMDKMIGKEFENGLANMKAVAER